MSDARPNMHASPESMPTTPRPPRPFRADWPWMLAALLLTVVTATAMRIGTGIGERPTRWDERYIRVPIDDLVRDGWSMRTAIDFAETKGPAFVWTFALIGKALGGSLGDLRLVSTLWLMIGLVPLLAIAQRCGVRGAALVAVAGLYLLLPQQAVLGQLLMSETMFVAGTLALVWTAVWGLDRSPSPSAACGRGSPLVAVILFGLLLAVLLHLRIHAVASAGAICVVAFMRFGVRSWPWWAAAIIAGLLRIPLWIRWGGLVSPEYQYMHQIGGEGDDALLGLLHPQNMAYLLAALAPWIALLGVAAWWHRRARIAVVVGAGAAALLAMCFTPSMDARLVLPPVVAEFAPRGDLERYLGLAGTLARLVDAPAGQATILVLLAALGGAGLGALWSGVRIGGTSSDGAPSHGLAATVDHALAERLVAAITFWTLLFGIGLYSLTDAFVVDRYLLPWAALLAIIWWQRLPTALLAVQVAAMTVLLAGWTRTWLLR